MSERVAIVGARDASPETLAKVRALVASLPDGTIVISGGARGVDKVAIEAAHERGLATLEHVPVYGIGDITTRSTPARGAIIDEEWPYVNEVVVAYKEGKRYTDGGHGTTTGFDVCAECFKLKIVPWFKAQGVEPHETEWDY